MHSTKDMVSDEWIDYADCQGRKHSHAHTHAHLVGLQFRSQLDVSCHTLCQLAKDEKRGVDRVWQEDASIESSMAFCPIARTN